LRLASALHPHLWGCLHHQPGRLSLQRRALLLLLP
jgi:hypothetical protein